MECDYPALVSAFCESLRLERTQGVIEGEPFYVNDVMFTLVHDEPFDDEVMFMFVNFGDLPDEQRARVMAALLTQNLLCFAGRGTGFSISPTSGRVNLCVRLELATLSARWLVAAVKYLSRVALEWRADYFLDEREVNAAASSAVAVPSRFRHLTPSLA